MRGRERRKPAHIVQHLPAPSKEQAESQAKRRVEHKHKEPAKHKQKNRRNRPKTMAVRAPVGESIARVPFGEWGAAKAALETEGYCVIEGVASEAEVSHARELFWRWMESLPHGISRADPSTLRNEAWKQLGYATGVLTKYSIGQSDYLWYCRTLPGVQELFKGVWDTDELITSFDGTGATRNPWLAPATEEWPARQGWYHVDQNFYTHPKFILWQGLLNLMDTSAGTGSTVVAPRYAALGLRTPVLLCVLSYASIIRASLSMLQFVTSFVYSIALLTSLCRTHLLFRDMFTTRERDRVKQLIMLNGPDDFEAYCSNAVQVNMRAGDFLLWDSRTVHCNQGPDTSTFRSAQQALGEARAAEPIIRLVAYICMIPRSLYTASREPDDPEKRRTCVERGFTATHDPVVSRMTDYLRLYEQQPHEEYRVSELVDWHLIS
jgi:hypothetical protein